MDNSTLNTDPLIKRKEAAEYLGLAEKTLAKWGARNRNRYGLRVVKMGRLAMYRKSELDAFIAKRTVEA